MSTLISGTSAYCTPQQFVDRWGTVTVGQLLTDQPPALTAGQILTDTKLASFLKAASGEAEGALFRGGRYVVADLVALAGTNAGEMLADLVADLTMYRVFDRRPDRKTELPERCQEAKRRIKEIGDGLEIFPFQEHADAGRVDHYVDSAQDAQQRGGPVILAERYFGRRSNQLPPPTGGGR